MLRFRFIGFAVTPLLLILAGCQGYPFSYVGTGTDLVTRSTIVVGQSTQTDILFVVDNSGSMADKQANLKRNANAFITALATSSNNYHIGVVTTDMFAMTDAGRLRRADDANAPPYFTAPDPTAPDAAAKRQALVAGFAATIDSLGTGGSPNEAGMLAVLYALAPTDPAVAAHNRGFLRDDADLAVIILTDEDDCSFLPEHHNEVATWTRDVTCYQQLQDLYPVDALVDSYARIKGGDIGRVRVGIITGGVHQSDGSFAPRGCMIDNQGHPSDACGCWFYSRDDWFCSSLHHDFAQPCDALGSCINGTCSAASNNICDTPTCPATPARRYSQFMTTLAARRAALGFTAGAVIDSICQAEYDTTLINIAKNVVLSNCFNLAAPAVDPNALIVTLQRAQSDHTYGAPVTVPRYDPNDVSAPCHSCGQCPQGAWQYAGARSVCLACGLQEQYGDNFQVEVLNAHTATTAQ